jgi:hypothetical protein
VQRSIRDQARVLILPPDFNPRETARYYHRLFAVA